MPRDTLHPPHHAQNSSGASSTSTMLDTLPNPPTTLSTLAHQERSFMFAHFTSEHAWVIGNILRNALRTAEAPAIIHISTHAQTLFHAPSMVGMMPDAETWVKRKRETVLRWGRSTWFMRCRFDSDSIAFAEHHGLGLGSGEDGRGKYTIEGGGYPVFVKGTEGVAGVIVVAGLEGDEGGAVSHGIVVKAVEEYRELREGFRTPMRTMTVK